ncbi:hypothetical protein [Streptomyces cavernae]|uniref:hypothetical protein n=1 Tax=Streptomyces cavernae TaxID=2259034 RepID=UPI0030B8561B
MDALFYVVPALITAVTLFIASRVVRRWLQLRGAWNSGLTAEARCLRMFTTTRGGSNDTSVSTTLHHVYEFTTRDGRLIRFEEEDGPATTLEGDIVTVHYSQGAEVFATARRPSPVRSTVATLGALSFLGVVVVFCVGFMLQYSQVVGPGIDFVFGSVEEGWTDGGALPDGEVWTDGDVVIDESGVVIDGGVSTESGVPGMP